MKSRHNNADFEHGLTDVDGHIYSGSPNTHAGRMWMWTQHVGANLFWKAAFYSYEEVEVAHGEWLRMGELDFHVGGIFELLQDGAKMHQCARWLLCCKIMILLCNEWATLNCMVASRWSILWPKEAYRQNCREICFTPLLTVVHFLDQFQGGTKVMPTIFFLRNYIYNYNEIWRIKYQLDVTCYIYFTS